MDENKNLYSDIQMRTNGEIYIGVVGPVRSGKSTFIKRFMEQMVLPFMEDENEKSRATDEMPQAAQGRTIMTTEPKFIPKNAATISVDGETEVRMRLVDCVGFLIDGATGHMEGENQRMVKTPWFDYEIPFSQAAEIGTQKVIQDHATIAVIVTSDGTIGEIERSNYVKAEEKTVQELKKIGKPFVLILNSQKPYSEETEELAEQMEKKYGVSVLSVNCEQLKKDDIQQILKKILMEFQITRIDFQIPKWIEMLPGTNEMKQTIVKQAGKVLKQLTYAKDVSQIDFKDKDDLIDEMMIEKMDLSTGRVQIRMNVKEKYYYQNMSELAGVPISGEYQLVSMVQEFSKLKTEYEKVRDALGAVRMKGYGVINPVLSEIEMDEPVLIRHGNKYGVKLRAISPSVHMIRANIETEIAPIVGNEEQAQDLINYIKDGQKNEDGVWQTNIFGKSIGELVEDGIRGKIALMDDECQMKLQDTMQKIVNDNNGGMVCIIL